ncbi:MAG TPA: S8 family peptidase [Flavisolibacter sp.]
MRRLILCLITFIPACVAVHAQVTQKAAHKMSPSLRLVVQQQQRITADSIDLLVTVRDMSWLKTFPHARSVYAYVPAKAALVRMKPDALVLFVEQEEVLFADTHRKPIEELTTGVFDFTANHVRMAQHYYPVWNGNEIAVSIKEQMFDTADIDFRGRWFHSAPATQNAFNSHASIMATIAGGGGNSSPYAKGVAWGASLTSSDYVTLLPDADSIYRQYNISVQNHSYGTGIENYYGTDAAAYDKTVENNPVLLHVFSAGNSGASTPASGLYNGITGRANLTGSFKMAKNIITVGAMDSFFTAEAASSRGPAYDGRVKPDVVAFGTDGTSGAAALVSGSAAIVQHLYKSLHGVIPPASLVRAVLLNTADDMGTPHVDYTSGYGRLNVFRAMQAVAASRFFSDSVSPGATRTFSINIPAGLTGARILLAWTDRAGVPNAQKALVNDLDLTVRSISTNDTWLPWVLSPVPHADSLAAPAQRKKDTLNTVEQVTLEFPVPGPYTIEVKGTALASAYQHFSITWQFDSTNAFAWSYPTASNPLLNNRAHLLRWQTTLTGPAQMQYAVDGGPWQLAASIPEVSKGFHSWTLPVSEGRMQLRMVAGANTIASEVFTVSGRTDVKTGFNCDDTFHLFWNQVSDSFMLYQLGAKYMEPVYVTADTFAVLSKAQHPAFHYSVAPVLQGSEGFRSHTIDYRQQGVGCYFRAFFAVGVNQAASLTSTIGTTYGVTSVQFQKLTQSGYVTIAAVSPALTTIYTDPLMQRGANTYRAKLLLTSGAEVVSEPQTVYYLPDDPVIVYPNPGRQYQPVHIITMEPDIYELIVTDAAGRMVHRQALTDISQRFPSLVLPAGLYFIRVISQDGNTFTRKLVVY